MTLQRLPFRALSALLAWSLSTLSHYTNIADRALLYPLLHRPAQAADDGTTGELPRPPGAYFARTLLTEGVYELTYGFENFNRDKLKVVFTIVDEEAQSAMREFGWRKKDVDAVMSKAASRAEAKQAAAAYFHSRGFRVMPGDVVEADYPLIARRNAKRISGLAQEIAKIAEKREYSSEDVIGAAAALVQTAVQYKIAPDLVKEWHIAGVYPPPNTLLKGFGKCDSKTVLLGSLLSNWSGMNMVGLSLPEHYLMGIRRVPRDGDAYVEYNGAHYVLIEAAGPAWLPPGTVGDHTQQMLEHMNGVPIQPF